MRNMKALLMTLAGSTLLAQFASAQIFLPDRPNRVDHDERTEGSGRMAGDGIKDYDIESVHVRLDRYGDFQITLYGRNRSESTVLEGEWEGRGNSFTLDVDRGFGRRDITGTGQLFLNSRGETQSLTINGKQNNRRYSVSFRFVEENQWGWDNRGINGSILGGKNRDSDYNRNPWYIRQGEFYDLNENRNGEGRFRADGLTDFDIWQASLRLDRDGNFSLTVYDRNRRNATLYGEWEQKGRNGVINLDIDQGLGERDIAGTGRVWLDRNNRIDRIELSGDRGNRRNYSINFRANDNRRPN